MVSVFYALRRFFVTICLVCLSVNEMCAAEGMLYPLAAAVSADGTIFVADLDLPGVWKFDRKWSIYFQGSKNFRTPLNRVRCLAIDNQGKLLAGDTPTREIYRFDDAGQPQPLTNGGVGMPMALAVAKDGTIYAADIEIQRIVRIPSQGGVPEIIAEVNAARGLAIDADGYLWVSSMGKNSVIRLSPDGKDREIIVEGQPYPQPNHFQHHIVLGKEGEAYITDGYAKTIWKVKKGEKPEPYYVGDPLKNPVGLAWWKDSLLIVDPRAKAVYRHTSDGKLEVVSDLGN